MSKFCVKCGAQLMDDDRFCTKCGAPVDGTVAAPETPNVFSNAVDKMKPLVNGAMDKADELVRKAKNIDVDEIMETAKKDPKKLLIPAIAAVAVVAVAVVLILILGMGGKPYTKALDLMVDVIAKGKMEKIEQMAPAEYWEYMEDWRDIDLDDNIDEISDAWEDMMEEWEDDYGDKIKVSYEIQKEEKLSDRKLKKLANALEENYDIDTEDVMEAYEIKVKLTIKGSDDDDTEKTEMVMVKIGKSWYMVTASSDYSQVSFFSWLLIF